MNKIEQVKHALDGTKVSPEVFNNLIALVKDEIWEGEDHKINALIFGAIKDKIYLLDKQELRKLINAFKKYKKL